MLPQYRKRIAVYLFDGFQMLDAFGPLDMISLLKNTPPAEIEVCIASIDGNAICPSGSSLKILPDMKLADVGVCDLLLIPGGDGTRKDVSNQHVIDTLRNAVDLSKEVMTVCTGSALLAKTGHLDGIRATSNKLSFDWVKQQGPNVLWQKRARWVEDGKFFTSSGISAGIDCIMAYIRRDYGADIAENICTRSEYIWNSDPNHDPFCKD